MLKYWKKMTCIPDSTFIEDVAICTSDFAVITNPGAESRSGEIKGIKTGSAGILCNN